MGTNVNARAEAIKEISKEKARILRKRVERLSPLEQTALAWKKKKEMEERERQKVTLSGEGGFASGGEKGASEGLSFRETVAKEIVDHDKQKLSSPTSLPTGSQAGGADEASWTQYRPWQKEEDEGNEEKKEISLNTATVVSIRKKLIAAEWRRALGKPKQDNRFQDLEREAVVWGQRKKEVAQRKEEIRVRILKHTEVVSEALAEFSRGLTEKKTARPAVGESMSPEELTALFEKCLEKAGEVFDIEWQQNNCLIWIEPWEEKRRRNISGFDIPVIYRAKIDENLQIASFENVEDEEVIESLREELLTKPLRESLKGISFNIDSEDEAREFLEDRLSEIGRLISLERTGNGWLATIESWEEMRLRNLKRTSMTPIITDEIEIDWRDGKLEFVPQEEKGADIEEEEFPPEADQPMAETKQKGGKENE